MIKGMDGENEKTGKSLGFLYYPIEIILTKQISHLILQYPRNVYITQRLFSWFFEMADNIHAETFINILQHCFFF